MANIELGRITVDMGIQQRAAMDAATLEEYAEAMRQGAQFPPIVVFDDGATLWLADGFHRLEAARLAGSTTINADMRPGDRAAALLYAVGSNSTHGLRRTNADKRRAVFTLLIHDEWKQWSDRQIARQAGVTHPFVAKMRRELILEPHDIAEGIPPFVGPGYDRLCDSMKRWGFWPTHPITLFDGKILDGRARYRAALETGTMPLFEEYTGPDPFGLMMSRNVYRQRFTEDQIAAVAAKLADLIEREEAGEW